MGSNDEVQKLIDNVTTAILTIKKAGKFIRTRSMDCLDLMPHHDRRNVQSSYCTKRRSEWRVKRTEFLTGTHKATLRGHRLSASVTADGSKCVESNKKSGKGGYVGHEDSVTRQEIHFYMRIPHGQGECCWIQLARSSKGYAPR